MNPLAINTVGEELEASAEFCRSEGIGIEITDFAFPQNLENDLSVRINRHVEAVAGITPVISHGPFFDLIATSPDPAIVGVARRRHRTALAASGEIGAAIYVVHTNFTPLIRDASYRKSWTERMLQFWLPLADEAGRDNMVICLENIWEPQPDIQAELIVAGGHPHLRATFDNGHALLFSKIAASDWVATLGDLLAHCHLHDNSGVTDEHKSIGEGRENWRELTSALKMHSSGATLVMESDQLHDNKLSLNRLRKYLSGAEQP